MSLQPGPYRIGELVSMAKVTRTTVDKWEERYSLEKTFVEYEKRDVAAYVLTEESIARILKDYPSIEKGVETDQHKGLNTGTQPGETSDSRGLKTQVDQLTTQVNSLIEELKTVRDELKEAESRAAKAEVRAARMEGQLESWQDRLTDKDQIIKAKDQAINASNAAFMIYEQFNGPAIDEGVKTLETTPGTTPQKQVKSPETTPGTTPQKNWLARFFTGS
jgi:uncharacterized protein (DUF3084 family)